MPPRIDQLPTNILADILEKLDDIKDLPPVINANSCFRAAFYSRGGIAETIIQRQIHPRLLALAVANYEVSRFPFTNEDVEGRVQSYTNILTNPHHFSDRLKVQSPQQIEQSTGSHRPLGLRDLLRMGRIHNCKKVFVKHYTLWASRKITGSPDPIVLTEAEELRFFIAFYRLELFLKYCQGDDVVGEQFVETRTCRILSLHPPWEREQIACASLYLIMVFQELSNLRPRSPFDWEGAMSRGVAWGAFSNLSLEFIELLSGFEAKYSFVRDAHYAMKIHGPSDSPPRIWLQEGEIHFSETTDSGLHPPRAWAKCYCELGQQFWWGD